MKTWHYGLVAQWWAEFNTDGPEIAYFQKIIEQNGAPALDVGCGAGRLLVPFLKSGLDVDGVDASEDMVRYCRENVQSVGVETGLYAQQLHLLDLPRKYQTIICCGSLGLAGTREDDLEGLRRVRNHLEPGGVFAFDHYLPTAHAKSWQSWVHAPEGEEPRWSKPDRREAKDGSELVLQVRQLSLDPIEQTEVREIKVEQMRDGECIATEQMPLNINLYLKNELVWMLKLAGFMDVTVTAGLEDRAPTPYEDHYLSFIAK